MLFISENLKYLRKEKDLTQEEVAEMIGVSAQSVSKWERGDTLPDITLLPALANLFKTSVDAIIGMDKINDIQTKATIFTEGHKYIHKGDINAAIEVYSEALKTFPNDKGLMSDLAMTLALDSDQEKLSQAIALCERVLSDSQGDKVHHTTRAALCFIYLKAGEKEKAVTAAQELPHIRESRESVLAQFEKEPTTDDIDAYLRFIAIGENDEQDIIAVDFGVNMIPVCTDYDLREKIVVLRKEVEALNTNDNHRKLPMIRLRDNFSLSPNQVRVRHYADYLLDKEFEDFNDAGNEIMEVLRNIVRL
jgi:transcriptional regulator with XRE-family HTH domain